MIMMGYGFGGPVMGGPFGWFGAGFGLITHLAFTVLIVMAAIWLFRIVFRGGCRSSHESTAVEILKQRYAKGELTSEEFQRMKKELQ